MSIAMKNILNRKAGHFKTMVLRLSRRTNFVGSANEYGQRRRMSVAFQSIPEKRKYIFPRRRFAESAVASQEDEDEFITGKRLSEHQSMHKTFENSFGYQNTIVPPLKAKPHVSDKDVNVLKGSDWSSMTANEIYEGIKKLTYCHMNDVYFEDDVYNGALANCSAKLPEFTDKRLKSLLQYVIVMQAKLKPVRSYQKFMKAYNKQCLSRFFSTGINDLLWMVDGFYLANEWTCNYMWRAIRKLGSKPQRLTPKQLIQLLFYLSVCRCYDTNMYDIECHLEECVADLTIHEIGLAARGFFMSQKKLRSKTLVQKIVIKLLANVETVNDVCLAAILKLLRYSDCCHCLNLLHDFFECLCSEVPRLSLLCLTHVSHACGSMRIYNSTLLQKISDRLEIEMKQARLKDCERVLYAFCTIAPYMENYPIIDKILNEILQTYKTTRAQEVLNYPQSFTRILTFLTLKNIYPVELLEFALQPSFIQRIHKNNMNYLTTELLVLHCNAQIELPTYKGPLLREPLYNCLIKKHCVKDDIYRRDKGVRFRTEVTYYCKETLGLHVHTDCILPHNFTADIICALDEDNNSVDVEHILSEMPLGTIKKVNHLDVINGKKIKWKLLFVLSQMQRVIGHDGYIGGVNAKFRQLKAIGYHPIPVHQSDWSFLTDDTKCEYLKKLIYQESDFDYLKIRSS